MKPLKTLLFVLGVFAVLAGSMWLTPVKGVNLGMFTFQMPTFSEMFLADTDVYTDVSDIIESQFDIDTLEVAVGDSLLLREEEIRKASYDSLVQTIHKIEMSEAGKEMLTRFFNEIKQDSTVRIMHYGDSQIEGDRITSYIRNKLQVKFGGSGIGLRPAVQPYDYIFSAVQENSSNWKRYPIYGKVDSLVDHTRYGVMGAFSRYAKLSSDTQAFKDSIVYEADFSIAKSSVSYNRTKIYKRMRMFYGNARRPVDYQLYANGILIKTGILRDGIDYGLVSCDLPDSTSRVEMRFLGWDGPDIYGIELGDTVGITVDNIALRGSSGTIFTKSDFAHSVKMYNDLDPNLFILQFGGNVMPYIKSKEAIERFGRYFKSQINRIKVSCPKAAIIVIGPSDMSTKKKDKYVTYEYLPDVVETLRQTAISSGCGYWDMYIAMGGHNSMPAWVNAEPRLAHPDYTHFSARGARLVASMFYNALIFEYNNFLKESR